MDWSSVPIAVWVAIGVLGVVAIIFVTARISSRPRTTQQPPSQPKSRTALEALQGSALGQTFAGLSKNDEPEPPSLSEAFKKSFSESAKQNAARHVEPFQTSQGTVIVGWMDERETAEEMTKAMATLGGAVQAAFNKKIISDELLAEARQPSTRSDEVRRAIGAILKARPTADLRAYASSLQIEITIQEGPAAETETTANPFFDSDQKLAGMKAIAEINRFHDAHESEFCGPGKPPQLCADFKAMINRHKKRILERM